jgi:hypothetical protein
VNEPEDATENVAVVGIALQLDQLAVDDRQAFIGFGKKLSEQIIHGLRSR